MAKSRFPRSIEEGILRVISSIPLPSETERMNIILSGIDPEAANLDKEAAEAEQTPQ